jgi:hypothetical protein
MSGKSIDWERVEIDYRAGTLSVREIGAKYGVSHTAVGKHASAGEWTRDLKAKIKARADAKVSKAMVSTEVAMATKVTENLRIEVESQVQARIRLAHRADIAKYRALGQKLFTELEADVAKAATLASRVKVYKDLIDVQKTLAALESTAYGLADAPPLEDLTPPDKPIPEDVARRLAFVFAQAAHSMPRTVQ